ncbi:thrombospondin [Marinomonas ushuaiensis DSM 15871]|uniref:Thrombospondin n=1 Tax=Marinomonas ushuaiensis DSM 15871 TaxID=1122207 RepID=X7E7D7_9GAMM|nr:thrombospondin [Marinomonas ushuaiensis DSM 15871]
MRLARIAIITFSLCSNIAASQSLYPEILAQSLKDTDSDGVINARDICENTPLGSEVDYHGCQLTTLNFYNFNFDVRFDSGQSNLKPEFHSKLENLASFLKNTPETTLLIEGHTDNIGAENYNLSLSKKRAESIANTLISVFNISPDRIKSFGFGEQYPLASNETEAGRQANRRVTGEIVKPLDPLIQGIYKNKDRPYINNNKIIIPFDSNQYTASKHNTLVIQELGEFLQKESGTLLVIEGHTDITGSETLNIKLSIERAQIIANILHTQHSVPYKRLKVLGYGSNFPITSNTTAEGRKQNRRVSIEVVTRFQLQKPITISKWTIWNLDEVDGKTEEY